MVVAGVGLAGMTLEVVTLFAFQVLHGYVYAEVSLIVTAFMAGLTMGAAGSNWLLGGWLPAPERRAKWALICVQLAIGVYSGAFALLLRVPIPVPALLFPLLALLGGMLGGMAFPLALVLVHDKGNAGHTTGTLYAADLAGGCLGALLGTALLVPLLGIPHTYAMIALVALACLLALV
jgi:spermidine synthase